MLHAVEEFLFASFSLRFKENEAGCRAGTRRFYSAEQAPAEPVPAKSPSPPSPPLTPPPPHATLGTISSTKKGANSMNLTEDIRSVTDLKRHTREVLDQVHATGRPVVLTVNGQRRCCAPRCRRLPETSASSQPRAPPRPRRSGSSGGPHPPGRRFLNGVQACPRHSRLRSPQAPRPISP